jgi:hypothetical protein
VKCLSMRTFGSCPGGMATGMLHSGPRAPFIDVNAILALEGTYMKVPLGQTWLHHIESSCEYRL